MPRWIPKEKWKDQEVFIIGGGESLRKFDWSILKPELTIGCNDAYQLGAKVSKLCIFGDHKWFIKHELQLEAYKGVVFTNCMQLQKANIPWLWLIARESTGLHKNAIGWNFNTGAAAINLALLLGAAKIYLLGFDMHLSKTGQNNWHPNSLDKPNLDVFNKFQNGFDNVAKDLKLKFPGIKVYNITDDSDLNNFPKISTKEFWKGRN